MWYHEKKHYDPDEEELKKWVGFVYVITDLSNDKKYIGKKLFWKTRKLPPLKGKKRKRTKVVQSDWLDYYGSSQIVQDLLVEHGPNNFYREIIHFCTSKGQLGYMEMFEQVISHALMDDTYYNGIIQCRINQRTVKDVDRAVLDKRIKGSIAGDKSKFMNMVYGGLHNDSDVI